MAEAYAAGRISLCEAARKMKLSLSEALDGLQRLGIAGNATADDTLQSMRSVSGTSSTKGSTRKSAL